MLRNFPDLSTRPGLLFQGAHPVQECDRLDAGNLCRFRISVPEWNSPRLVILNTENLSQYWYNSGFLYLECEILNWSRCSNMMLSYFSHLTLVCTGCLQLFCTRCLEKLYPFEIRTFSVIWVILTSIQGKTISFNNYYLKMSGRLTRVLRH